MILSQICLRLPTLIAICVATFLPGHVNADEKVQLPYVVASSEKGWPQFRGPGRDGVSNERGLQQSWPEGGPKAVWTAENLGRGYSSPIIADGRIYLTGDVGEELHIRALDLAGRPLWQSKNGAYWRDPYPGARASVTFSEGRLYHENAHGRLACLDAATSRELWAVDLLERFGGKNITWGLSECVLVDDHSVYATAGGRDALVVAFDKVTGELRWKSPPLRDDAGNGEIESASYVSPILIQFAARRYLVGCSLRHLFCVDAENGTLQWTRRFPTTYGVIAMMPALVGDGIFMTAPHGKGGRLFNLVPRTAPRETIGADELWHTRLDTLQGCVVRSGEKLIGSYYGGRKGWAAIDAQSGEVLYDLPDTAKGAPLLADGRVHAYCEDGSMLLLDPREDRFEVTGRFRFANADDRDAWAHPVIHDGRLYLRYHDRLTCYDIRATE
ncbi:MAG: PQQ-binding-like beta-propeller repeat protein [Chthoniobacteraceae bacterium]